MGRSAGRACQMKSGLRYTDAGVDIAAGNALVDAIKPLAGATARPGVVSNLGGFGGLFDLKAAGMTDPVLVAATDGVGTKLKIAIDSGRLDTVGIDLVAMCVNDLICQGATPLFFLDYLATGALDVGKARDVIKGIAEGCTQAGCALLGGETAEMPGMYADQDFDLAGFAVGAFERGHDLPQAMPVGTALIGVASSGLHSNGYSLVRHIMAAKGLTWTDPCDFAKGTDWADVLLTPTRIYTAAFQAAQAAGPLLGMAHITGGGLTENVPRMLPKGMGAEIDLNAWNRPALFTWLQRAGDIAQAEMLKTFNCGIGLVMAIPTGQVGATVQAVADIGMPAVQIGEVIAGDGVDYK